MDKIDELLEEVGRLRAATKPADEAGLVKAAYKERDHAIRDADEARADRDRATAELAEVKAAVQWTMGKLRIADIIMMRSENLPAAEIGWLKDWGTDPEDTRRVEWINRYGRMGLADSHILFSLPHSFDPEQETIPEIFNFRHFVDVCRRTYRPPAALLPQ